LCPKLRVSTPQIEEAKSVKRGAEVVLIKSVKNAAYVRGSHCVSNAMQPNKDITLDGAASGHKYYVRSSNQRIGEVT
jgi:hypothetical protein